MLSALHRETVCISVRWVVCCQAEYRQPCFGLKEFFQNPRMFFNAVICIQKEKNISVPFKVNMTLNMLKPVSQFILQTPFGLQWSSDNSSLSELLQTSEESIDTDQDRCQAVCIEMLFHGDGSC